PTDIIKNFLLGHASTINNKILDQVRTSWKEVIINLDNISSDNFFRQYIAGVFRRKISMNALSFEFKNYYLARVKEAKSLADRFYNDSKLDDNEENVQSVTANNHVVQSSVHKKVSLVKFSSELSYTSQIYRNIQLAYDKSILINRKLNNLKRIKSLPSYIFLLRYFYDSPKEKDAIKVLGFIETFMLRWYIDRKSKR